MELARRANVRYLSNRLVLNACAIQVTTAPGVNFIIPAFSHRVSTAPPALIKPMALSTANVPKDLKVLSAHRFQDVLFLA